MKKLRPRATIGRRPCSCLRVIKKDQNPALLGQPHSFPCHLHSILSVADGRICLWPTEPVTPEPQEALFPMTEVPTVGRAAVK